MRTPSEDPRLQALVPTQHMTRFEIRGELQAARVALETVCGAIRGHTPTGAPVLVVPVLDMLERLEKYCDREWPDLTGGE